MKKIFAFVILICFSFQFKGAAKNIEQKIGIKEISLSSPDSRVKFTLSLGESLSYYVKYDNTQLMDSSPLGIDREDEAFSSNLQFISKSEVLLIDEQYELKSGKRLLCHNWANEQTYRFENSNGKVVELILRVYNDGVAFRYRFPDESTKFYKITKENTGFKFFTDGKAWIHPYDWRSNKSPCYEQYCQSNIAIGTNSPNAQGWAYPMLFNTKNHWIMVTEAALDDTYCATHVKSDKSGLYTVVFAAKEEVAIPDDPEPMSQLPWASPWRVIIIGDQLADIIETSIIQNLNPPSVIEDTDWIKPGRAAFSWWSDQPSTYDYEEQIKYIDFAADMGWEYILIDAGWHKMTDNELDYIMAYAQYKEVGVWLWYKSGLAEEDRPNTFWDVMSDPQRRKEQYDKIAKWGVKGIKFDFFDSDKQGVIELYKEFLEEAMERKLMVTFHGCTLPRGWERTYPNLMTMEAVSGSEKFTSQYGCNQAPAHNATIPFTRNVVGSMDYAPLTFSNKIYDGVESQNITTYGHQLALSVVFESGIQHFADNRMVYAGLQAEVLDFLKKVPTAWDDTKLVCGYPGDYVVIARRKGNDWYIGGINGNNTEREIKLDLSFLPENCKIRIINDTGERGNFIVKDEEYKGRLSILLKPYGGFTINTLEGVSGLSSQERTLKKIGILNTYPNPSNAGESVSVRLDIEPQLLDNASIEIFNISGINVKKTPLTGKLTSVTMPYNPGIYVFRAKVGNLVDTKLHVVK